MDGDLQERRRFIEAQQERRLGPVDTTPPANLLRPVGDAGISAAAVAIRKALTLIRPDAHGHVEIKASQLAMEVLDMEHTLPAIAWAIHLMVKSGELTAHVLLSLPWGEDRDLPKNVRLYRGLDYNKKRDMPVPFGAFRVRTNPGWQGNGDVDEGGTIDESDAGTTDERAAALKAIHPSWTDKQLAAAVGCNVKTLYKANMVALKRVKKALASEKEKYQGDSTPDRRRRPSNLKRRTSDDG